MPTKIVKSKNKLSEARLRLVEQEIGIDLPEQYRIFLLKHNGGQPQPAGFHFKYESGPYTDSVVDCFLAIYNGPYDNFEDYYRTYKVIESRLPLNLVPIAHDPGGNLICICISGSERGSIYFWDHEKELQSVLGENVHFVASSFQEFLDSLEELDTASCQRDEAFDVLITKDLSRLGVLLDAGWSVDTQDHLGMTLIEHATILKRLDTIKFLLKRGAKIGRALQIAQRGASIDSAYINIIEVLSN